MALNFKISTGGIGRTLRHRAFRIYFAFFFISTSSRWIQRTGFAWLTWELTHSPTWLGIIAFSETFPLVVFSLWGGAVADRVGSLRLVRVTLLATALASGVFAVLAVMDLVNIWGVLVLTAVVGSTFSFGNAAQTALVSQLVPKEDLSAAFAFGSAIFNASRFIGPGIAGLMIATVGTPSTIVAGAIGTGAFALALFRLPIAADVPAKRQSQSTLADIGEGIRYVIADVGIRNLMILLMVTALLVRPYMDLLSAFSDDVFGRGADGLALLLSMVGLGGLIGGVWLAVRGRNDGLAALVVISLLISAIALLAFTVTKIIWIAAIASVCLGVFMLAGNIGSQTLIQGSADPAVRARVMAVFILMAWGTPALGAIIMGWIASLVGLQLTVGIGAGIAMLVWIWARRQTPSMTLLEERAGGDRAG